MTAAALMQYVQPSRAFAGVHGMQNLVAFNHKDIVWTNFNKLAINPDGKLIQHDTDHIIFLGIDNDAPLEAIEGFQAHFSTQIRIHTDLLGAGIESQDLLA